MSVGNAVLINQKLWNRLLNGTAALRKYCHAKGCDNFSQCPETCKCNTNLDLDTAIAWDLACGLDEVKFYIENSLDIDEIYIMLQETVDSMVTARGYMLYHYNKYSKLLAIVNRCLSSARTIRGIVCKQRG